MLKKHFLFLGVLLLFMGSLALAQVDPLLRVEIDAPSNDVDYYLIPCDTLGFAVFYKTINTDKNKRIWLYRFYNQLMIEQWEREIPIIEDLNYFKSDLTDGFLYISLYKDEKIKEDEINYQVLKLDCEKGNFELFGKTAPQQSHIKCFKAIDNKVITGFNTQKETVEILLLNTLDKIHKTSFSSGQTNATLEDIYIDKHSSAVYFVVNYYESKSEQFLRLFKYTKDGDLIWNKTIQAEEEKKFNTCKISIVQGQPLLLGTYDMVKSNMTEKKYFRNEATGFYSIKVESTTNKIKYYNFLEFENFKGFIMGAEFQKLKSKNNKSGTESVDYDLLLHDIYQEDSVVQFMGEAYFEEYHTETDFYYDYYGRSVPVSYTVFDGYRYFNAFIASFNTDGEMIWDNGFELFDLISYQLQNKITYYSIDNDIVLSYNQGSKIVSKVFSEKKVIDGLSQYAIETDYIGDKVMESQGNSLVHWYDNYFLGYGIQTIHNRNSFRKNKRIVFYVNKLGFK